MAVVTKDPQLKKYQIIHDEKFQTVQYNGATYHHVKNASDGRWIYEKLRPRA